jgi:hypothetical protein
MNPITLLIEYCLSYRCKKIQYSELCSVCLEREKNTAFFRCGHKCVCEQCADKILSMGKDYDKCPICRRQVVGKLRIYE